MTQLEWRFTPICFWRRGNLPFAQLATLVPRRTLEHLDAIATVREELVPLSERLAKALYLLVPNASPKERRALIALQRDVHNQRHPRAKTLRVAKELLAPTDIELLTEWLALHERQVELEQRADAEMMSELRDGRQTLAQLGSHEDLVRGLQLSGSLLQRNVKAFAEEVSPTGETTAELRKVEKTLVSYLYRMALKPSPFGSFTEVGAQPWASRGASKPERRRMIRLSRMLTLLLERPLYRHEVLRHHLPLRLANTAIRLDKHIEVFTRGADGNENMYTGERFVNVPRNALVDFIWNALQVKEVTSAELIGQLDEMGVAREQAAAFIERLVAVGLLERSLGIPEQAPDYVQRMSQVLTEMPLDLAARCGSLVGDLVILEQQFAAASVEDRDALMTTILDRVNTYQEATGSDERVEAENMRSLIFEDVGSTRPPGSWATDVLDDARENLIQIQRMMPLFDNSVLERIGLYELFARHYGPEGRCHDLFDFYRHFAKLDSQTISELMLGRGTEHAEQIRTLRAAFMEHLREHMDAAPGQPTVALDAAWVENFVGRFPAYLWPIDSVAYRMQMCAEGDSRGLVLNGAVMGYGAQYSRFCDLVDPLTTPNGWLSQAAIEADKRHWPNSRSLDLIAVLGMNTNLHPRLTQLELEYPRCRAYPDSERVLNLRDLTLVGDAKNKRIQLLSKRDGQPLHLVPMNFLFPAAGPILYRFLCAMTPFVNFRAELWGRYISHFRPQSMESSAFPRVQLGNVVLQRRTWYHRVDTIPAIRVEEDAGVSILRDGIAWRQTLGLPREGFYRISDTDIGATDIGDWVEEVKKWSLAARRARLRKPHYIDFANPFLLKVLFKQLETVSSGYFLLQECLPATDMYIAGEGPSSAEEFVVELNRLSSGI